MKNRLDVVLTQKGFFPSREKVKGFIMAGLVYVDGQRVDKAGTPIKDDALIEIKDNGCPFVSRGGTKLKKAIDIFNIDLKDKTCIDMGASTGGFTDCMLREGATKVFAIDVGYGQLDYKLREDPKVINMERTNIRYLDTSLINPKADFVSIDVSFISLSHMLPVANKVTKEDAMVLALIKPQFEAGKDQVGKGGIVRDAKIHVSVIEKVIGLGLESGFYTTGLTYSPIKGAKGNIEYLILLSKNRENKSTNIDVSTLVKEAHSSL